MNYNKIKNAFDSLLSKYNAGQYLEVIKAANKLIISLPTQPFLDVIVGNCYKKLEKIDKALYCYNKALTKDKTYADAYTNIGNIYDEQGEYKKAIKYYDKAVSYNKEDFNGYYNRASTHMSLGSTDKAIIDYEKSLLLNKHLHQAYLNLSYIKQYNGGEKHVEYIIKTLDDENIDDEKRYCLCFAIANFLESSIKKEETEKIFNYFYEGNRLRKKHIKYNINNEKILFQEIKNVFSNILIKESKGKTQKVPIFIVGMPRSGTSLTEQILSSHPQVYGAGELNILNNIIPKVLNKKIKIEDIKNEYYREINKKEISKPFFTDKMPLNFRWIGFIFLLFPDAKVIHLNRDPIATCFSIYKTLFISYGNGFSHDLDDLANYYIMYKDLMKFWSEKFPDKIYELKYEYLINNQKDETLNLLKYCELDWNDQCLNFYQNKRGMNTASNEQVRKPMYKGSNEVWKNYEEYLQPMIKILNEGLKNPAEYLAKLNKASDGKVNFVKPTLPGDIH